MLRGAKPTRTDRATTALGTSASVPAAHSMDTTWFAVDADGRVAAFETGEPGALPIRAAAGPEGGHFDDWPLDRVLVARALGEGTFPDRTGDAPPPAYPQEVVLVLAPDPDGEPSTYRDAAGGSYSVHGRLGDGWLVVRDASPRVVASTRAVDPKRLAKLAHDAGVARVILADEITRWREDGGGALFRFSCSSYDDPGAYVRDAAPSDPLDVASLPSELRDAISALRLDVSFARTPSLHLADHLRDEDCYTWSETTLRGEPRDGAPVPSAPTGTGPRRAALTRAAVGSVLVVGLVLALAWALLR